MSKLRVQRERIESMVAGKTCEVFGDWLVLSDDFGVAGFPTHAIALNFATNYARLANLHRNGPIQ